MELKGVNPLPISSVSKALSGLRFEAEEPRCQRIEGTVPLDAVGDCGYADILGPLQAQASLGVYNIEDLSTTGAKSLAFSR